MAGLRSSSSTSCGGMRTSSCRSSSIFVTSPVRSLKHVSNTAFKFLPSCTAYASRPITYCIIHLKTKLVLEMKYTNLVVVCECAFLGSTRESVLLRWRADSPPVTPTSVSGDLFGREALSDVLGLFQEEQDHL